MVPDNGAAIRAAYVPGIHRARAVSGHRRRPARGAAMLGVACGEVQGHGQRQRRNVAWDGQRQRWVIGDGGCTLWLPSGKLT